MWALFKSCIENETKTNCGDFGLEVCSLQANTVTDALDLTSAVLPNTSGSASGSDFKFNSSDNGELSFARFLSADFIKHPFILACRERKTSVVEESQKQSTPVNLKPKQNYASQAQAQGKADSSQPEVWGSPLKINIPEDDSSDIESLDYSVLSLIVPRKQKPRRLGIPLKLARKVISTFNIHSEVTSTLPTLLVLCDGGDAKKTAILGVKMFTIPREKDSAKGLKVLTVTVDDKGSVDDWKTEVKMGEAQAHSCQAIYDINTGPSCQGDMWGTIAVEIKWKGVRLLLETPPTDASTTVKACVHPGCPQSRVSDFYQELQFLRQIISTISTNEIAWVSNGSDQAPIPLTTAVANLIQSLQETGSLKSAVMVEEEERDDNWNLSTAVMNVKVAERKDLDFTDKLWKVLTNCMSTSDLVASLRLVFTALGRGQLRPFVDRYNQTTLARLVRGALSGRFFAPGLTGVEPFVLLAEAGAEKLRRDYISFFVSQGLANPSTLERFTDTEKDLQPKLQDLEKLHNIVEMMTLLGVYLRLPQDTLSKVAHQMLSHYEHRPYMPHEVFTFPVKTSEVRCVLGSVPPVVWCVEATHQVSGISNVSESSLYCLSAKEPFFHLQGRMRGMDEKGDNSKDTGVGELSALGAGRGQYCLVHRKESVVIV